MDIAGVQNPKPHMIDEVQDNIDQLRQTTSVQYGQRYLFEKHSHIYFHMEKVDGFIIVP